MTAKPDNAATWSNERLARLVHQARSHGVRDPAVLRAVGTVPRERFVSPDLAANAFDDSPLPIGSSQTISQPAMVALMAEAARINPDDHVLEVGTGSGYGAAVLSVLCSSVVTVERLATLAERARRTLRELRYDNVTIAVGDGTLGWPDQAPYDAIIVTAAGPTAPAPLLAQLGEGGRLIIPIGSRDGTQRLMRYTRTTTCRVEPDNLGIAHGIANTDPGNTGVSDSDFKTETLTAVRFVPLIGTHGFDNQTK